MKTRVPIAVITILAVSGCATSYKSSGFSGGYSETMLAPDVVRVVFRGNGYTRKERVQDLALLRAAELTLQAGFPYFAVLNESNETRTQSITTAGTSYTTGSAYAVGNRAYYSGQTTYSPGQTLTLYKPETGILVQFLKDKPQGVFAFDAAFLVRSLKEKYKLE